MILLCAATLLASCAAYKTTLETSTIYDLGEPTERTEVTKSRTLGIKTAFVSVDKDEQSSSFAVDRDGAFVIRTGGSGEAFDGVTGPVRSLEIAGDAAVELAPFVSQYLAAERAADAAAKKIAERVVEAKPTPTPIPSVDLRTLELGEGGPAR